ncbi:unnamed protein product [Vitrella brassicaformis CCMP3155]|uniref:Uncharacterized protein n=1 Tax=Vitrella brassicaformis (strain CCMP3155) TaxID=1169540 RepID=A0A0G4E8T2_VITBC|nr:unnamed protein product [Vitrella brassicaformis CCMP3155]|eukprot:CEL91611.1 unnamed protein product [Vitrella brassicaformis CCMP3155]
MSSTLTLTSGRGFFWRDADAAVLGRGRGGRVFRWDGEDGISGEAGKAAIKVRGVQAELKEEEKKALAREMQVEASRMNEVGHKPPFLPLLFADTDPLAAPTFIRKSGNPIPCVAIGMPLLGEERWIEMSKLLFETEHKEALFNVRLLANKTGRTPSDRLAIREGLLVITRAVREAIRGHKEALKHKMLCIDHFLNNVFIEWSALLGDDSPSRPLACQPASTCHSRFIDAANVVKMQQPGPAMTPTTDAPPPSPPAHLAPTCALVPLTAAAKQAEQQAPAGTRSFRPPELIAVKSGNPIPCVAIGMPLLGEERWVEMSKLLFETEHKEALFNVRLLANMTGRTPSDRLAIREGLLVITRAVREAIRGHKEALKHKMLCIDHFLNNVFIEWSALLGDDSPSRPLACQPASTCHSRFIDAANVVKMQQPGPAMTPTTDAPPPSPPAHLAPTCALVPLTAAAKQAEQQAPAGTRSFRPPELIAVYVAEMEEYARKPDGLPSGETFDGLLSGVPANQGETITANVRQLAERLREQFKSDGELVGEGEKEGIWMGPPTIVWGLAALLHSVVRGHTLTRHLIARLIVRAGVIEKAVYDRAPLFREDTLRGLDWDAALDEVTGTDGRPTIGEVDDCPLNAFYGLPGLEWVEEWQSILSRAAKKGLSRRCVDRGTLEELATAVETALELLEADAVGESASAHYRVDIPTPTTGLTNTPQQQHQQKSSPPAPMPAPTMPTPMPCRPAQQQQHQQKSSPPPPMPAPTMPTPMPCRAAQQQQHQQKSSPPPPMPVWPPSFPFHNPAPAVNPTYHHAQRVQPPANPFQPWKAMVVELPWHPGAFEGWRLNSRSGEWELWELEGRRVDENGAWLDTWAVRTEDQDANTRLLSLLSTASIAIDDARAAIKRAAEEAAGWIATTTTHLFGCGGQ